MSVVYEATHEASGDRVALKVLRPERASDPDAARRLEQEAQILARLASPHIVRVRAFTACRDGRPAIVMDHAGPSLASLIGEGLSPERATAILAQLCRGLSVLHGAGLVHRDLKPANVCVDGRGTVRIIDFGITRRVDATEPDDGRWVAGTARYMAPEQARGEAADARSDLYSVGVIAFEMLMGRPPFVGRDSIGLMVAHVRETPPRFAELRPGYDAPALEEIVLSALSKSRDERPASAQLLAMLLARAQPPVRAAIEPPPPASFAETERVERPSFEL